MKNPKYVTIDDGIDFRSIAAMMTDAGYRMNHATARNITVAALKKFAEELNEELGSDMDSEKLKEMLKDQELHTAMSDVLYAIYHKTETER